jgi:hypothetical protein
VTRYITVRLTEHEAMEITSTMKERRISSENRRKSYGRRVGWGSQRPTNRIVSKIHKALQELGNQQAKEIKSS